MPTNSILFLKGKSQYVLAKKNEQEFLLKKFLQYTIKGKEYQFGSKNSYYHKKVVHEYLLTSHMKERQLSVQLAEGSVIKILPSSGGDEKNSSLFNIFCLL